jgi:glycosyltransferase involved in cell wall biosynthesis
MSTKANRLRILGCASQGTGGDDEARLRVLLSNFVAEYVAFDKRDKKKSFFATLRQLKAGNFDLFVLEGTGVAAGLAAILGSLLYKRPYVVSSGDAVEPFLSASLPKGKLLFSAYERMLYKRSSGFIGWSPYLVGRALTMGSPRGVTAAGWAPFKEDPETLQAKGEAIRASLGIPANAVVFGIVGSLMWSERYQYCYGSELVRAARKAAPGSYVLIVGDGSGLPYLKELAGAALGRTIFLPGRVRREEVPGLLAAMDIGSLPQSVDGVGSFRYTTKIAEYRSVGLPFLTNQVPMGYDLDRGDIVRLPGASPWSDEFVDAVVHLMNDSTREAFAARKARMSVGGEFDRAMQVRRVTAFLEDLAHAAGIRPSGN